MSENIKKKKGDRFPKIYGLTIIARQQKNKNKKSWKEKKTQAQQKTQVILEKKILFICFSTTNIIIQVHNTKILIIFAMREKTKHKKEEEKKDKG